MDLNLVKRLIKLVDSSEITDLEVEENGIRIKIAKKIRSAAQPQYISQPVIQEIKPAEQPAEIVVSKEDVQAGLHEIRSPIVGTFYRAPGPDADPYVQIGDNISQGSVLCIVEAMKLMNEIESDVSGRIVKILVDNGKPVEYNQPLFLIQPS